MSFIDYLKEKWMTYIFAIAGFIFALTVYKLDNRVTLSPSNAAYIMTGLGLLFVIFAAVDYAVLNSRAAKLNRYCSLNAFSDDSPDAFVYPMDREYAKIVHNIMTEYEKYKADMRTQSSEQLEFITKY